MSSFPEAWLRLREPFDHAARSDALARAFADALPERPRLVELGGGLGSGIRYLSRFVDAEWTLVDHDPELLARVQGAATRRHDLRDMVGLDLEVDGVCCQALLDLCDVRFLADLAAWVAARGVPFLAALTVDGRVDWDPVDPDDAQVQAAFRVHQLGDRGFGASPGPRAAAVMADQLAMRGYGVRTERADWRIGADATAMVREMVEGAAHAAAEVHPDPARVEAWRGRRLEQLGALALAVGHLDLLAVPVAGRAHALLDGVVEERGGDDVDVRAARRRRHRAPTRAHLGEPGGPGQVDRRVRPAGRG